jgi:hypothetical protein
VLDEDYSDDPTEQAINNAIGKAHLALASDDLTPAFKDQESKEAAADALLEGIPEHPDRDDYEKACRTLGFDPKPDADLIWFAERYSHYAGQYDQQNVKERARIKLWHRRGFQAKKERPEPKYDYINLSMLAQIKSGEDDDNKPIYKFLPRSIRSRHGTVLARRLGNRR